MRPVASDKFLVRFVESFDRVHLFFLIWLLVVGPFAWMIWTSYRRATRRNFTSGGPKVPPYLKPKTGSAVTNKATSSEVRTQKKK